MKIEIDVTDFWMDGDDLEKHLAEHIKSDAVHQILSKIKDQGY